MYFDFLIEIPKDTGKISLNRRGGISYVEYTYGRRYVPEKKYNIPKRTTIGKISDTDSNYMYPNPNFIKYFPEVELPELKDRALRSSCLRIGTYIVIKKIIEEYHLDDMMKRIIGHDSGLFLDLAAYSIITENNVGQYYPDYGFNHPLFTNQMRIYSDSRVSDFITSITCDQSIGFLNEWNASRSHREKIYISYDSTNKSCQAGDIEIAEFGHPKDGKDYPIFNYSIAYDHDNREPLFYEEYPGSIIDMSQLQIMLEKAKGYGYKNAGFILDRGYFSKGNIRFMDKNGYDFVIMMKGMKSLVRELIPENRGTFEDDQHNNIRQYKTYGMTIKRKIFESDEKERYFHLYYSSMKHASEQELLEAKLDRMRKSLKKLYKKPIVMDKSYEHYFTPVYYHEGKEDQLFELVQEKSDVIQKEIRLCGYFCIITSKKMSAKDALELYKSRDASEKLFKGDKSYLGNKAIRVQSDESAEAKIFIEFVALVIRNKMYTNLKDTVIEDDNKANYMNVPAVIRELEKIEMIRQTDGEYRLDHAVTATQKAILKVFKMDAGFIQREAGKIRTELREGK
ncbi:MAG: transposase [Lachnospiraceae bacterium]|nr:transposase [Lachnospiraceae bacterium]